MASCPSTGGLNEISPPATTREFMCVFPLKPDATAGVTLQVPRADEMVLHERPQMVSGVGGAGECLRERRRGARTGYLTAM